MKEVRMQPPVEWIKSGTISMSVQASKSLLLSDKDGMQLGITPEEPLICFEGLYPWEISKDGSLICPMSWEALKKLNNSIYKLLEQLPEEMPF